MANVGVIYECKLVLVELVNTYYTQGHIIVVFVDILISLWMYI